jgi:hypothetical protein
MKQTVVLKEPGMREKVQEEATEQREEKELMLQESEEINKK